MIDLRSDTISMPTNEMLQSILGAVLGDDGRTEENGRGEDFATNQLEDMAAALTGKEAAVLFPTGTMGNTAAVMSTCRPGDNILVGEIQHIYVTEKALFDPAIGQMIPITYQLNERNAPDIGDMRRLLQQENIKLITYENTHNFTGGSCVSLHDMEAIYNLSREYHVPIHLDGARLFNAAAALKVSLLELCQYVDSVMFCLSKGLGTGLGSLLCSSKAMENTVREKRKLLGGAMRQTGIIAAPGIYALKNNVQSLALDHENAAILVERLKGLKNTKVQRCVETNIVMLDVSATGLTPEEYCSKAKEQGLLIRPILNDRIRLVFYRDIDKAAAERAAEIIKILDDL